MSKGANTSPQSKADTTKPDNHDTPAAESGVKVQQVAFLIGLTINFIILFTFPKLD